MMLIDYVKKKLFIFILIENFYFCNRFFEGSGLFIYKF